MRWHSRASERRPKEGRPSLLWFRQDLRLADNPALAAAAAQGPVIPLYVLEDNGAWPPGGAARWWLHESLVALAARIPLVVLHGAAAEVVPAFARTAGTSAVYWNRRYDPAGIACDKVVEASLKNDGVDAESFNGRLLFEPWEISTSIGGSFKVFTAFARACAEKPVRPPGEAPRVRWHGWEERAPVDSLGLKPQVGWYASMEKLWQPGELGAKKRLRRVAGDVAAHYKNRRDFPAMDGTSRLSPHLHFGEVSPQTVWHAASRAAAEEKASAAQSVQQFLRQLIWREFSWHLLYHFPALPEKPWNPKFARFHWRSDPETLRLWQKGLTGYPIVDAGMRQLWRTGWMHNRVRMIAGSFLVKHLLQDWRSGEEWFWDTLVDADLANNAAGWQ